MDQELWNLLFGWITGQQCFLPEGCSPPLEGVLVYILLFILLAAGVVTYSYRDRVEEALDGWK